MRENYQHTRWAKNRNLARWVWPRCLTTRLSLCSLSAGICYMHNFAKWLYSHVMKGCNFESNFRIVVHSKRENLVWWMYSRQLLLLLLFCGLLIHLHKQGWKKNPHMEKREPSTYGGVLVWTETWIDGWEWATQTNGVIPAFLDSFFFNHPLYGHAFMVFLIIN